MFHQINLVINSPSNIGSVPVIVTAFNECGINATYDRIDYDCTEGGSGWKRLSVSPNPNSGDFTVKFEEFPDDTFNEGTVPIHIYDNNMALVSTVEQGSELQTYNLTGAQNGMYYIFTTVDGKVHSTQFMIDLE